MRATPWSPDGSDNALDIQVGMKRPAEMVPRDPKRRAEGKQSSKDLLSQGRLRAVGVSAKVVPGAEYLGTGQVRQQSSQRGMSKEDRRPVEGRLNGSRTELRLTKNQSRTGGRSGEARSQGSWSERHTEEGQCHLSSESESQKKIAPDTAGIDTHAPPLSHGGSSASDTTTQHRTQGLRWTPTRVA